MAPFAICLPTHQQAAGNSPKGDDIHAALLQRNDDVLGRKGTRLAQVEDNNIRVDLDGDRTNICQTERPRHCIQLRALDGVIAWAAHRVAAGQGRHKTSV